MHEDAKIFNVFLAGVWGVISAIIIGIWDWFFLLRIWVLINFLSLLILALMTKNLNRRSRILMDIVQPNSK